MILIIDYGVSNIRSVALAIKDICVDTQVSSNPTLVSKADKLVLPGVSSYSTCMNRIKSLSLVDAIKEQVIEKKKPILGICIGMQVFSTKGHEHGITDGFNFIEGEVVKLESMRVPHMGWNKCMLTKDSILLGKNEVNYFYFANSFHLIPVDKNVISAVTKYDTEMVATIEKENLLGCQFHPERSGQDGMQVLKRFCTL